MNLKKGMKDFWNLLWKDDSFKGWVFSIAFIFLFIKFIFFPVLSLATGTSLPLAIVESCSMYHKGGFFSDTDSWWESHGGKYDSFSIEEEEFDEFSMRKGFTKGDILFIVGADPEKLDVGDIIIFVADQKNPIIHRIVDIKTENGTRIFSTLGDNNPQQLHFEESIFEDRLVGKAAFKVAPHLGWVKLLFYEWKRPISERGFCDEN
ncbi:MAG: signal peptidase I [Nanoarchaeota archaeon]|nr:signal peptidase I [Nanoarchaeota archaeon]